MTEEQKKKYPPSYRFDIQSIGKEKVYMKKAGDEPEFELNPKLREEVYRGMPANLPVEEKALFIYFRLSKILKYDENFIYSSKFNGNKDYITDFNKEKLEAIGAGSPIICSDFCRIYKKFLDELGPELEGVLFTYGVNGVSHWSVGFYTDKFSLEMDPIDIQSNNGYSDLMALKSGMWPVGIKPDSNMTPENMSYLVDAIDRTYAMATGEYAKDYENLIDLLREIPDNQPTNLLYEKIESFREMLRNKGISGNEAIITFMLFSSDLKYFGDDMKEFSFAWRHKEVQEQGEQEFERICLIKGNDGVVHEVNFNSQMGGHKILEQEQLQELIASGEIKYEDSRHIISMEEK